MVEDAAMQAMRTALRISPQTLPDYDLQPVRNRTPLYHIYIPLIVNFIMLDR